MMSLERKGVRGQQGKTATGDVKAPVAERNIGSTVIRPTKLTRIGFE